MEDDRVLENDARLVGAWKGLVIIGVLLSLTLWAGVQSLVLTTSATGWLGVLAWGGFAVSGALVLAFVGMGLLLGVPWIRYRKRARIARAR